MTPDFILFTIIVLLPIIAMCCANLFIDHFYPWWINYQEHKYIRRAKKIYKEKK